MAGHKQIWKNTRGRSRHGKKDRPNDEALVRCRKCSGSTRRRLGPKLRCRCEPEKTRENVGIILKLEEGKMRERNAKKWKVEEQKSHQKGERKALRRV